MGLWTMKMILKLYFVHILTRKVHMMQNVIVITELNIAPHKLYLRISPSASEIHHVTINHHECIICHNKTLYISHHSQTHILTDCNLLMQDPGVTIFMIPDFILICPTFLSLGSSSLIPDNIIPHLSLGSFSFIPDKAITPS